MDGLHAAVEACVEAVRVHDAASFHASNHDAARVSATTKALRAFAQLSSALTAPKGSSTDPTPPTVPVSFVVTCDATAVGDRVGVVGSADSLGAWHVSRALWLTTDVATFPTWRGSTELPCTTPTYYKYVVCAPDGRVVWEPLADDRRYCPPRPLPATAGAGGSGRDSASVVSGVVDTWASVVGNVSVGHPEASPPHPLPADDATVAGVAARIRACGVQQLLRHYVTNFEHYVDEHPWVLVQALRCTRVMAASAPAIRDTALADDGPGAVVHALAMQPHPLMDTAQRCDPRHTLLLRLLQQTAQQLAAVAPDVGRLTPTVAVASPTPPKDAYVAAMRQHLLRRVEGLAVTPTLLGDDKPRPSSCMRRVMRELWKLPSCLPLSRHGAVYVAVDKRRPYIMKALLSGPSGTPYAGGLFLFDVVMPASYPSAPPRVQLLTTGGGTVRFSPNLYKNGRVCLSLLGTWHGTGSETWSATTSSLLQVLVSVQSLILGAAEPFFLEPGMAKLQGTPQGHSRARVSTNGGWERLRAATVEWAVTDMLEHPPPAFEDVVRQHFRLVADDVRATLAEWEAHAAESPTPGYHYAMLSRVRRARQALDRHTAT